MDPDTKTCSRCGTEKPLREFYENQRYRSGRDCWCKGCRKDYASTWAPPAEDESISAVERRKRYFRDRQRVLRGKEVPDGQE